MSLALRRLVTAAILAGNITACAEAIPPNTTWPQSPAVFDTLGVTKAISMNGSLWHYELRDGRTFEVDATATPILFNGGTDSPFVLGSQDGRPFAGVFTRQDGLPATCWIAGIGGAARERGSSLDLWGVLWPKASTFPSDGLPRFGEVYPSGARFCFDERAEVTAVVWH